MRTATKTARRSARASAAKAAGHPAPQGADLLYGVEAIGDFLGFTRGQAKHRADKGQIPTFKMGRQVCATRSGLTRWLESLSESSAQEAANGQRS